MKTDARIPSTSISLSPFLKWAGGKRWLTEGYGSLLPDSYGTYIEPFLGGGAVFFHLRPQKAILGDANQDLIETYRAIAEDAGSVVTHLRRHQARHSKEHYYATRAMKPRTAATKAARFIYLNRTCWNGLYRVNLNGKFNVPIGTKTLVIGEQEDFENIATCLKSAELVNCDFEETINRANKNDFVFVDPPYTVAHNLNGFIKYNEHLFTWNDQIRLRDAVIRAKNRGATVLVLNANHASVREIYQGVGSLTTLQRSSVLAATSRHRGITEELAVICRQ